MARLSIISLYLGSLFATFTTPSAGDDARDALPAIRLTFPAAAEQNVQKARMEASEYLLKRYGRGSINVRPSYLRMLSEAAQKANVCSLTFSKATRVLENEYNLQKVSEPDVIWLRKSAEFNVGLYQNIEDMSEAFVPDIIYTTAIYGRDFRMEGPGPQLVTVSGDQLLHLLKNAERTTTVMLPGRAKRILKGILTLTKIKDLSAHESWLACSHGTEPDAMKALSDIWERGMENGDLFRIYQRYDIVDFWPYDVPVRQSGARPDR